MGKYDLANTNFSVESNDSNYLDWTIYAFQGHTNKWLLKENVASFLNKQGFTLKKEREPTVMIGEHPEFNSTVKISFSGNFGFNGEKYSICFHSSSFKHKNEEALMQKNSMIRYFLLYHKAGEKCPSTRKMEKISYFMNIVTEYDKKEREVCWCLSSPLDARSKLNRRLLT